MVPPSALTPTPDPTELGAIGRIFPDDGLRPVELFPDDPLGLQVKGGEDSVPGGGFSHTPDDVYVDPNDGGGSYSE